MDKSESELLEEWDLVSSASDTEQENGTTEKKTDICIESSSNGNVENASETVIQNSETDIQNSETDIQNSETDSSELTDVTEIPGKCDTEQTSEAIMVSEKAKDIDSDDNPMTENNDVPEPVEVISNLTEISGIIEVEETSSFEAVIEDTTKVSEDVHDIVEPVSEVVVIPPCNNNEQIPEIEMVSTINNVINQICNFSEDIAGTDIKVEGSDTSIQVTADETVDKTNDEVKIESNIVDDDHAINSSLDSSMEHIQIEQCEGSFIPELTPEIIEQENAAIESSSSDIDIIDENVEENITSSFVHPLSLSISSSVDTSSILTTPSEDIKADQETEKFKMPEITDSQSSSSYERSYTAYSDPSKSEYQRSTHEDREESQRSPPHSPHSNRMFGWILELFRNMTHFEWSILGGVMLCLYVTIVFNQTNIFAVEKEDVVLQMKKMIDELKYDNKILKDQMLSEMKNEKVFSSFEHQIKELKKENSKLNHMLYDVAKVLEEQKDTQKKFEKRESDYIAPFKKEINKLKEHINTLKFDNEELQKQLVRMRYSSYSQGTTDDNVKEHTQKGQNKADETASTEEISLDFNSLKKWNELISLLTKELGLENKPLTGDKPHSDTYNISWYWKLFLQEFKGTFKDFKANVTSVISDYKIANEKAVSEIYKFVKDFFTVQEDMDQKHASPDEENSQWKNIGDFVNDLGEKWTKIKDRLYASDFKKLLFKNFKKSEDYDNLHDDSEKAKGTSYEYNEKKTTNTHFESRSDGRHEKKQSNVEDSNWMFKRAELRTELRDSEKDDESENWYLKRKKHMSQDEAEKVKY